MADIWMDVGSSVTGIPVNISPLVDSSDGITIEDSVTYDYTGLVIKWNFVTTGGDYTQYTIVPTTMGVYDWTNNGGGMYSVAIPASGGDSANNDTPGFGWISGIADGVAPWRGPIIGFRSAVVNDALIDGGDTLDIDPDDIAAAVYNASRVSYNSSGTFGEGVSSVQGNVTGNIEGDVQGDVSIDTAAISDAIWDENLSGHTGSGSAGATLSLSGDPLNTAVPGSYAEGTAGYQIGYMSTSTPGANQVTINVQEANATPIPDVNVIVLNSDQTAVLKTGVTDANGQYVAALNDGTYCIRLSKAMVNFTVPEELVVSGETIDTFNGTIIAPDSAGVDYQTLTIVPADIDSEYNSDAVIYASVVDKNSYSGGLSFTNEKISAVNNSTFFSIQVPIGETIHVIGKIGQTVFIDRVITVSEEATADITDY